MIINTMYFGEVEIEEKSIIQFEEGLPGFEDVKEYAILTDANPSPFKWLQSVKEQHPAFAVINPFEIKHDYEFDIDETTEKMLAINNPEDIAVYSIVVIPEDITKMTTNLKAPIIINTSNNKARQMIMDNSPYQVKHYILDELVKANELRQEEK